MRIAQVIFFFLVVASSQAQQRILFVGNSLTYYNDLPEMVKKIARQDGIKLLINSICKPNYALEDHWIEGKVVDELKSRHYDIVVFQQGPSALASSRKNLIEYALLFSKVCRQQHSTMAFYSVWPSGDRLFDFPAVLASYTAAADTTKGTVCAVGDAWLALWEQEKDFPLYAADGFHPSEHGSLLAAMVIYGTLFQKTNLEFVTLDKLSLRFVADPQLAQLKNAATKSLNRK
jgi:hypothetical protein